MHYLLRAACPGSALACRFRIEDDTLAVHGRVDRDKRPLNLWSFDWQVLTVLADEVCTWVTDTDSAHPPGTLHVSLHIDARHAGQKP